MNKEQVIEKLKEIVDPELGIDIYTLGLIYDIKINNKNIYIKMTFTTPFCPYGPMILGEIKENLKDKNNEVNIDVVFEPIWEPSDDVKEMLGLT